MNIWLGSQEIHCILINLKALCYVGKNPPLVPTLSHINSFHNLLPYVFRTSLILFFHLYLILPCDLFPLLLLAKMIYTFHFSTICHACLAHLMCLDVIILNNNIWQGAQIMKLYV